MLELSSFGAKDSSKLRAQKRFFKDHRCYCYDKLIQRFSWKVSSLNVRLQGATFCETWYGEFLMPFSPRSLNNSQISLNCDSQLLYSVWSWVIPVGNIALTSLTSLSLFVYKRWSFVVSVKHLSFAIHCYSMHLPSSYVESLIPVEFLAQRFNLSSVTGLLKAWLKWSSFQSYVL